MAMYAMTVTGEWGASDGRLLLGQVTCAFGAQGSVAAMETARDLLAALFAAPETQPPALWQHASPYDVRHPRAVTLARNRVSSMTDRGTKSVA